MTPEDQIKKLLSDELDKRGIEDARVKRIAESQAALADFQRRQREPRPDRESAVDATSAPVHYDETVLPLVTFSSSETGSDAPPQPPPLPVDLGGGEWTTVMYCDGDGGDVLRQVLSRPVP